MLDYENREAFVNDNFHGPSTSQFARFVIIDSTLYALEQNISPIEKRLLGDDFGKIKRVRDAIAHLDILLNVKSDGQFDSISIVQFISWCAVLPSIKSHHDNEHDFYEKYLKQSYTGQHTWPAWNTVFNRRKTVGLDVNQRRLDAASFQSVFSKKCGTDETNN